MVNFSYLKRSKSSRGEQQIYYLLLTTDNLWKRKILQEPICQKCRKSVETIGHPLLDYKVVKKIWFKALFKVKSLILQLRTFSALSRHVQQSEKS